MAPIINATRKRSASASDPAEETVRPSKVQRLDSTHQSAAAAVVEAVDDSQNIGDGPGFIINTSYGGINRGEHAQQIERWMNELPEDAGGEDGREVVEVGPLDVAPVAFGEDLTGQEAAVIGNGDALAPVAGGIDQPDDLGDYLLLPGVDYGYYGQAYGGYAQEAMGDGHRHHYFDHDQHRFRFADYVDVGDEHAEQPLTQDDMAPFQEQLSVSDYGEPGFYVGGNYVADHPVIRAIMQGPAYPAAQHQPFAYQGVVQGWQAAGYNGQQGYENGAASGIGGNLGAHEAENHEPDGYGSHDHPIEVDDDDSASEEDDEEEEGDDDEQGDDDEEADDDEEGDEDEQSDDAEQNDDDEPEDYGTSEHPIDVDDGSSSSEDGEDDEQVTPSSPPAGLTPGQAYVYISATEQQQARMLFDPEAEPAALAPGQAFVQVGRVE